MKIDVQFVDEVAMVRTGSLASVLRLGIDFQKAAPTQIKAANGSATR